MVFDERDVDKSGLIDMSEMSAAMNALKVNLSEEEVRSLFKARTSAATAESVNGRRNREKKNAIYIYHIYLFARASVAPRILPHDVLCARLYSLVDKNKMRQQQQQ